MSIQGKYLKTEVEFSDRNGNSVESGSTKANGHNKEDKVYTYDEALDLVGKGWYTYGLLAYILLAFQAASLDLFSLSVVMTGACDMNFTHYQKSVLLSVPFIGSIVMAWPWGYIADTQGRRRALVFSMWGSFILSTMNAFSPNWIVMAVLKFGSTALSSGTQSIGYTLLGESCSQKLKAKFMVIVTTSFVVTFGIYTAVAYLIFNLEFSFDFNFITFSNWRLLMLIFASTLGLSALFSSFILESPKFLLNEGHEKMAIEVLRKIIRRNGGDDSKFPVKRIVLNEMTTVKLQHVPLWKSLRDQTLPLFKPPLLCRTMQLFYITATVYASNNGVYSWLPFIFDTFYSGYKADNGTTNATNSVCDMIVNSDKLNTGTETCTKNMKDLVLWLALIQSASFMVLNLGMSLLSRWKKSVVIGLLMLSAISGVAIPSVTDRLASMILINVYTMNVLAISLIFSYYVDLFPTSYRGMASCLGVMVARSSSIVGCNLVGSYIASHCATSFYVWVVYILSGVAVSLFLPPDNVQKPCIDIA